MIHKKLIQISTILLLILVLAALFLPAMDNYGASASVWSKISEGFFAGAAGDILTGMLYYVPVVVSVILVALLESKIRYAVSLLSAAMGLTLVLSQYLFPAMENAYLFSVYQVGVYALLGAQIAVIVFSCVGICLRDDLRQEKPPAVFQGDTMELPLEEIDAALLEEEGS